MKARRLDLSRKIFIKVFLVSVTYSNNTSTIRIVNMKVTLSALLFAEAALAFPWVSEVPGVDSSMLPAHRRRQQTPTGPGSAAQCPFNANHQPAVAFNAKYPYNNAQDGKKGNEKGGFLVPAKGDTAHRYIAPTSKDIRGPCPGLVSTCHNSTHAMRLT